MDYDKSIDLLHEAEEGIWFERVLKARSDGSVCAWASSLHPQQLSCHLDGNFPNGSYNVAQKLLFQGNTVLILRFPRVSRVSHRHANEKVAMEVEVLRLIRQETTLPVPEVWVWGVADMNPLDLGPFILMTFIEGICFKDVLISNGSRVLKYDIPDDTMERIYRQMANIMLQLFKIDFRRIGSLPAITTNLVVPTRPLTWKAHDILRTGGVNTFRHRNQEFSTTRQYFHYVLGQDWQQLQNQPNSVAGERTALLRYTSLKVLESLIPEMIAPEFDEGPFKIICDDLDLANMIVKSSEDLTIVGIVDLEWVYAGPAQLFCSAPWWLLYDRPINPEWDFKMGKPPGLNDRFFKYLDIFVRIPAEEESKTLGAKEVSTFVKWSVDSGAMWLHMPLSYGFLDMGNFPCMQLQKQIGLERWGQDLEEVRDTTEVKNFIERKMNGLIKYDADLNKVEEYNAAGKMTREEFVASVRTFWSVDE